MILNYEDNLQVTENDIRNDKIEIQVSGIQFTGDLDDYENFTRLLSSPSNRTEDENDPDQGWIFNNREFTLSGNDYMNIRTSEEHCDLPAPLFGGKIEFFGYETKNIVLHLQFNPTRLFEYQSVISRGNRGYQFDPNQPFQTRREEPLFNGRRHRRPPVEFPLDGNDNVIISAAYLEFCSRDVWTLFLRRSLRRTLQCIVDEFERVIGVIRQRGIGVGSTASVTANRLDFNLKSVESYFELRPQTHHANAIELVEDLKPQITSWSQSIVTDYPINARAEIHGLSPSISLSHRRNRTIKVYAKTNNRVRFEMMQTGDGIVGTRTTTSLTELVEKIIRQSQTAAENLNRLLNWISEQSSATCTISRNPHRLLLAIFTHSTSSHAANVIVTHLILNRTVNPHSSKPVQRSVMALKRKGILRTTNSGGKGSTASYTVSRKYRSALETLISIRNQS